MAFCGKSGSSLQRLCVPHLFLVELPDTHSLESSPTECRQSNGGSGSPLFPGRSRGVGELRATPPGYASVSVSLASVSLSLR